MTPKEKAIELVDKFLKFQTYTVGFEVDGNAKFTKLQRAKQCALIAVDEIIDYEDKMQKELEIDVHKPGWLNLIDWEEVKNEIELL